MDILDSIISQATLIITGLLNLLVVLGKLWSSIKGLKFFLVWIMVIVSTLLVPTGIIIWFIMYFAATYFASITEDMTIFVTQVAWGTGSFGSIYPLLWGIYLFPLFSKLLNRQGENSDNA